MSSLLLSPPLRAEIASLVVAAYPDEACGLLLGRERSGRAQVLRQWPARNLNVERSRDRFELDPLDYLAAEAAASQGGMSLLGVWHSHPDHPARPSVTDRELAWPGWSYLIVAVSASGVVDWRSWRLAGEDFCEEELGHD